MPVQHFGWIGSLRGLAALLVVFIHLVKTLDSIHYLDQVPIPAEIGLHLFDFFDPGKAGIVIFFLVSGWLVPEMVMKQSLSGFFKNRFLRLYPAYWLSIIWTLIYCYRPDWYIVAMNATMLHKFFGVEDLISVYWTLQIEIVFYFVCVYLKIKGWLREAAVLRKLVYGFLCCGIALAAARFFLNIKLPVALPLALAAMLAAQLWRLNERKALKRTLIVFFAALAPVCFLAYNRDYGYHETWYRYLISYVAAFLFFALFKKMNAEPKVLLFLGKISYSMYLLHPVTGIAFAWKAHESGLDTKWGQPAIIFLAVLFILGASAFSYFCIERPSIRFGKRLTRPGTS